MIWGGRWNHTVDLNGFYNYAVHTLRPRNTESGETEIKKIGDKSQDNNDIILHKNIISSRKIQITDIIKEVEPPLPGQLDNGNWMNSNPFLFLEDNNITTTLQKGSRWSGWLTAEETSWKKCSITFLNFDNSIMYNEVNKRVRLLYLPLKQPLTMTISMYCKTPQTNTYMDNWSQS